MGEQRPAADQAQRDRLVRELDRTLFVEAGAGSGKTTQLVHRIVELLVTGTLGDISQLAAITFTEAAAAELRDRVRERLEAEGDAHPDDGDARERIERALDHIDDAAISTLHGFAHRILASYPVEAGLPPGFEVIDEVAAAVDEREHWDGFLDDLFADAAAEPILRRAFTLGLTMNQLAVVAREFAENWDRIEHLALPEPALAPVDLQPVVAAVDDAIAFASTCRGRSKSPGSFLELARPFRQLLTEATGPEQQLLVLLHDEPSYRAIPSTVVDPELVELRARLEAVKQVPAALLEQLRLNALQPLLGHIRRYTLARAEARRREGRISFHDLLVLARAMLSTHPSARRELGARFRLLLIDEFQDTDPLQIEIALLLALRDPDARPASWEHAEVDEGRLFFVGDPKQSIYRFRRADIAVFERVRRRFSAHGVVELTVNFRTVPSVLAWVNTLFDALIGPEARDGQPRYLALGASRPDLPAAVDRAPVSVLGGELTTRSVAELREVESRDLARTIAVMKHERVVVHPKDAAGPRPLSFGDVTILIPSRVVLGELERALDREAVPYRVESRSLVFGTDEVRELLAILQAIDDPGDEVAVVAALRSPAFACSDDVLARYKARNPSSRRWVYTSPPAPEVLDALPPDDPVLAAMRALRVLHEERVWLPVNELVERVIRERRMVELAAARRRPRDHWRRLRLVQDEARAFVTAGGLALADFIAYIEQQSDEKATRVETVVSERDDDAVRILTIHGSKGLEFPVVVLAGLGIEYRAPRNRVYWTDDGPEIALGGKDDDRFETPGYAAIQAREEQLDRFERDRLLYVAATRARDHLVVSLYRSVGKDCAAARIARAIDESGTTDHQVVATPVPALPPLGVPAAAGSAAPPQPIDLAAWARHRAALLAEASRAGAIAPTGIVARATAAEVAAVAEPPATAAELADLVDPSRIESDDLDAPDAPEGDGAGDAGGGAAIDDREDAAHRFGRRGHAGTAVGRAVHGTLQVVDLAAPTDLAQVAAHQATVEGVADRAGEIERLARSAIGSSSVQAAVGSGRYWRELYVTAPLGRRGVIVEGYIDLLYESAEGDLVVVDYKTDAVRSDQDVDASLARYRLQGAAYAAVLEAALGRKVSACVFVFARRREDPSGGGEAAVERTLDDLPAAIAEVIAAVG
jgi:ATP-dependent helicase/nuclease subunit A